MSDRLSKLQKEAYAKLQRNLRLRQDFVEDSHKTLFQLISKQSEEYLRDFVDSTDHFNNDLSDKVQLKLRDSMKDSAEARLEKQIEFFDITLSDAAKKFVIENFLESYDKSISTSGTYLDDFKTFSKILLSNSDQETVVESLAKVLFTLVWNVTDLEIMSYACEPRMALKISNAIQKLSGKAYLGTPGFIANLYKENFGSEFNLGEDLDSVKKKFIDYSSAKRLENSGNVKSPLIVENRKIFELAYKACQLQENVQFVFDEISKNVFVRSVRKILSSTLLRSFCVATVLAVYLYESGRGQAVLNFVDQNVFSMILGDSFLSFINPVITVFTVALEMDLVPADSVLASQAKKFAINWTSFIKRSMQTPVVQDFVSLTQISSAAGLVYDSIFSTKENAFNSNVVSLFANFATEIAVQNPVSQALLNMVRVLTTLMLSNSNVQRFLTFIQPTIRKIFRYGQNHGKCSLNDLAMIPLAPLKIDLQQTLESSTSLLELQKKAEDKFFDLVKTTDPKKAVDDFFNCFKEVPSFCIFSTASFCANQQLGYPSSLAFYQSK